MEILGRLNKIAVEIGLLHDNIKALSTWTLRDTHIKLNLPKIIGTDNHYRIYNIDEDEIEAFIKFINIRSRKKISKLKKEFDVLKKKL